MTWPAHGSELLDPAAPLELLPAAELLPTDEVTVDEEEPAADEATNDAEEDIPTDVDARDEPAPEEELPEDAPQDTARPWAS